MNGKSETLNKRNINKLAIAAAAMSLSIPGPMGDPYNIYGRLVELRERRHAFDDVPYRSYSSPYKKLKKADPVKKAKRKAQGKARLISKGKK